MLGIVPRKCVLPRLGLPYTTISRYLLACSGDSALAIASFNTSGDGITCGFANAIFCVTSLSVLQICFAKSAQCRRLASPRCTSLCTHSPIGTSFGRGCEGKLPACIAVGQRLPIRCSPLRVRSEEHTSELQSRVT